MPRQRNPNRETAKRLWLESGKTRPLKGIAAELGETESRIRKWKSEDTWGAETLPLGTRAKRNVRKPLSLPKPRGAPPGNQNAAGHGAPKGNQNNLKHGLYQEVYFDTLTNEERAMVDAMGFDDPEPYFTEQLQLLTVRERRLLQRIHDFQEASGGVTLESVVQRKLEIKGNVITDNRQNQTETTTRTISAFEVIMKLEAELTRVQRAKACCILQLHQIRQGSDGEGNGNMNLLVLTIEAARKKWGGD